ncbi:MAG: hypothetical protein J7K73_04025 [Nanoarchaeota archaeon]|nr:hypothetical protein [Nanoarchaeota archaeon]
MNLYLQILTTLSLVGGIFVGELAATKVFGVMKKTIYFLAEIVIFVALIVVLTNSMQITDPYVGSIVYFIVGFTTIVFVRGVITGLGLMSEKASKKVMHKKDEMDYLFGLRKSLERRGFSNKEIKRIAKEVGFSEKLIEKAFDFLKKL